MSQCQQRICESLGQPSRRSQAVRVRVGQTSTTRADSGVGLTTVSQCQLRSPLCLFLSSKTYLTAGNRESRCQGLNDHTFSQEETLAGVFQTCMISTSIESIKTPKRLKTKPTGRQVLPQRRRPSLVGEGPCCCATARCSLLIPSCLLATGGSAVSPASIRVLDWITCKDKVA